MNPGAGFNRNLCRLQESRGSLLANKQMPVGRSHTLKPTAVFLATALCAWSSAAFAFTANVVGSVHLRAGPSIGYPGVTLLPPGAAVEVIGCEGSYGWCDVQSGQDRGWIDAWYLQASSPSGSVVIAQGGATLGLPMVTFTLGTYWDSYYRGRPWYRHRSHYMNYWNRYPHGGPAPRPHRPIARPPSRPPSPVRPVHPRPPANGRPPGATPPPGGGRPPNIGGPPGGT
jgi:uncharacterized protein YraI